MHEVDRYYLQGEKYDWIDHPRGLEKIFHQNRARIIRELVGKVNSRVLDLGCGTGLITRDLPGDVLGIDLNLWNLKRAKKHGRDLDLLQSSVTDLPLQDRTVDLVMMTEVLEHLTRPDLALKEAARVMKRSGRLLGSVPSNSPIWRFRPLLSSTHPHSEPFHRNFHRVDLGALLLESFHRFRVERANFTMNFFFATWDPR